MRDGGEAAFTWLLERYHAPLHRTARMYVATGAQGIIRMTGALSESDVDALTVEQREPVMTAFREWTLPRS